MTETSTITIEYNYTVKTNKVLEFIDQQGFYFSAAEDDCSLFNKGQVYVSSTDGDAYGATSSGDQFYFNSVLWNEAGAVFSVAAHGTGDAYGYYTGSWGPDVRNDGTFNVTSDNGNATGEMSWSPGDTFTNSGEFTVRGAGAALGVYLYNGGDVINTGVMRVHGGTQAVAVEISFYQSSLTNSGKIIASSHGGEMTSIGVQISNTFSEPPIVNTGLIRGDYSIAETDNDGYSTITNSGKLIGEVHLGSGNNVLHNDGTIRGDVVMAQGEDLYDGQGVVHGAVVGGLGDDTLSGGRKGDLLYGDELSTSGQDGRDVLTGGGGADTLHGGGGADSFVYLRLSDSAVGESDLIWDLRPQDRIDLSAIDADTTTDGDQAFVLVSSFDHHAGELAISYDSGTDLSTLTVDVDGDGSADMAITIRGDQTGFTHFVL